MNDAPINSVLRDQAFLELIEIADRVASLGRSIGEASYRGDELTVRAHLQELRLCCIVMLKTYNEYLAVKWDGQGVAEASDAHDDRADQRPRDGVA